MLRLVSEASAAQGAAVVMSAIVHLMLARALGSVEFGRLAMVLAVANLLSFVARAGTEQAAIRLVAKYYSEAEWGCLRAFIGWSEARVLAFAISLVLVLAPLTYAGRHGMREDYLVGSGLALACVPLISLSHLYTSTIRAMQRVRTALFFDYIVQPTAVLLSLALFRDHISWHVVLVTIGLAAVIRAVVARVVARRSVPPGAAYERSELSRDWQASSNGLAMAGLSAVVLQQTPILLLGTLVGAASAGVFASMHRVASLLGIGLQAVNYPAAPTIARQFAAGEQDQLQQLVSRLALMAFAATSLCAAPVLIFSREIAAVHGPGFESGVPILVILVLGHLVNAASGSVCTILNMTGHERVTARVLAVAATTGMVFSGIFTLLFGSLGAAVASTLVFVSWNVVLVSAVRTRLGIVCTVWGRFSRPFVTGNN